MSQEEYEKLKNAATRGKLSNTENAQEDPLAAAKQAIRAGRFRPVGSWPDACLVQAGVTNYVQLDTSARNRWGDYTGTAFDPSAAGGGKVWFHGGYASAVKQWSTWVGSS